MFQFRVSMSCLSGPIFSLWWNFYEIDVALTSMKLPPIGVHLSPYPHRDPMTETAPNLRRSMHIHPAKFGNNLASATVWLFSENAG